MENPAVILKDVFEKAVPAEMRAPNWGKGFAEAEEYCNQTGVTDPAIERAARALFKNEPGPYADCIDEVIDEPYGWRDHVDTVEIVLKALREPSDETLEAGNRAKPYNLQGHCEGKIDPVAKRPWQAMIDHLLAQITLL